MMLSRLGIFLRAKKAQWYKTEGGKSYGNQYLGFFEIKIWDLLEVMSKPGNGGQCETDIP